MLVEFSLRENPSKDRPRVPRRRARPRYDGFLWFDLDVLGLDDRAVALLLVAQEHAHRLGRGRDRVEPQRDEARLDLLRGEQLLHLTGEAGERFARRTGGRRVADPRGSVVAG